MAEFAANNTPSSSTKLSPFFCTKGYNPRMSFTETDLSASTTRERLLKQKASDISEEMKTVLKYAQDSIQRTQEDQARFANRKRKDVTFKPGELV